MFSPSVSAFTISTRTPHAGSDDCLVKRLADAAFQPALPMRGVTLGGDGRLVELLISTRTPHAGSDERFPAFRTSTSDFNPHSPCGE